MVSCGSPGSEPPEAELAPPSRVDAVPEVIADMPAIPIVEAPVDAAPAALPIEAPPPPADPEVLARAERDAQQALYDAEWPLHGVCYHFLGQVYSRPDDRSPVVGYMRRGAQFRAKRPVRGHGCSRGFAEVVGGGYVCRGSGFTLGDTPQTFEPSPVQPSLESALPYAYARVGVAETAQYWRLPSRDDERSAGEILERLRAPAPSSGEGAEPDLEAPPGATADAGDRTPESGLPEFFRMRMLRGFYVSVDREERTGDRRFYRSVRGGYVSADAMVEATPPAMRGVVLGDAWQLPLAFVYRRGVSKLRRDGTSGALVPDGSIDVHTAMPLQDEVVERRGTRHRIALDGTVVRENALRVVTPLARPRGVGEDERWVHVDLSDQTLVAYEGDRPVFATLVSSGREGFATPAGTFRIQSKHISTTMDDPEAGDEAYSIEDVPWTMYFEGSFALHAAFWHDQFGRVRSHGCVNLAPADARWLFQWTSPALPPGWHGVVALTRRQGTVVHVTE